ncbi:MAG: DUF883 family protein [Candidatus Aquicultor sp.]
MRITGGTEGNQPEGPLEKGMENVEESMEAGKRGISDRLEDVAERIDQTGESVAQATGKWEENVFHLFSNAFRNSSDYVQGIDVNRQLNGVRENIRRNPTQAVLVALGIGLVLGFVVRRRL